MDHISDYDLERYYLGMIKTDVELAPLEAHLLACLRCINRAEQAKNYVDAIRAAIVICHYE